MTTAGTLSPESTFVADWRWRDGRWWRRRLFAPWPEFHLSPCHSSTRSIFSLSSPHSTIPFRNVHHTMSLAIWFVINAMVLSIRACTILLYLFPVVLRMSVTRNGVGSARAISLLTSTSSSYQSAGNRTWVTHSAWYVTSRIRLLHILSRPEDRKCLVAFIFITFGTSASKMCSGFFAAITMNIVAKDFIHSSDIFPNFHLILKSLNAMPEKERWSLTRVVGRGRSFQLEGESFVLHQHLGLLFFLLLLLLTSGIGSSCGPESWQGGRL